MAWIYRLLAGGLVERFTGPLLDAYRAKLNAANDADRIAAEVDIARLEGMRSIAMAEAADRWSATRIGRLLIVIPFGVWWAAVYLVQVINPWFGLSLVVIDVPARIHDMALILIPAIVIGDAAALIARRK
ncbi:hypothetical protein AX761_22735 [Rhizobium sp. 58]|nr:hypothetical protein AX761_22735 [Rhizobium sp. 58]